MPEPNSEIEMEMSLYKQLMAEVEAARQDIGDYKQLGSGARFYDPQPPRSDIARRK